MLESGMREGSSDYTIPIPDVSHRVFLAMLEFIYSDDVAGLRGPGALLQQQQRQRHHLQHLQRQGASSSSSSSGGSASSSENQPSLNQRMSSMGGGGGGSNNNPPPSSGSGAAGASSSSSSSSSGSSSRVAAAETMAFAMDLLSLADQYLLDGLKRKCEQAILRAVSCSNVSAVLATADSRNAADLRRRCLDYIYLHFQRVIATKAFAQLSPPLLHEVLVEASRRGVSIGGGGGGGGLGVPGGAGAGRGGGGGGYPGGWGGY
jgi:hypothetical protein